ncbi:S-adenosyl-L-methionine-dependent methyltransferase [Lentinula edodes]|uniref:S-adenosyl-L-methionine-dependent methyltransferase n=1 Tax=Lentinula edodes TaxID=5353 RepID=A0A1Q3E9F6_LENED|nr:S-adenosyl-L-methionine-dependent methyltransferase [Lentinula edodes]
MAEALKALVEIISTETDALLSAYATHEVKFPSIDETSTTSSKKNTDFDVDPTIVRMRQLIVAAAAQLIATVQPPGEFLQDAAPAMFKSATLGFVIDVDVPEILMEAGPMGLHVKDLAIVTGVDDSHLARVLRYLATRHIFREVEPNVFAHNRNSTLLSKSKSLKEIKEETDELLASSVHLSAWLRNPEQAPAAFNMGCKTPKKLWDWYKEPNNEARLRRFTVGMKANAYPSHIFTNGIHGDALKADDIVVDIGGSLGTVTLVLKKAFPSLNYVVQDIDKTITASGDYWREHSPEAFESGQVKLQAHNFFEPQPVKNAAVYFLRNILHDWPDEEACEILSNIRDAAGPNSKLIVFESLARYTCEDSPRANFSLPEAPYPLLKNLGVAGEGFLTALDLGMLALFNGKERTLAEFEELGIKTAWRLESVKPGSLYTLVFSPITGGT